MTAAVHVFLGPSLALADARGVLPDAAYHPPVKMGDVQAVLAKRPRVIVLVDGYFERVPAVWHKEVLFALSQGVRVVGASSMGALRAAELHTFGMEGIGGIFEAFRDGVLTADDEVALVHGSADDGYRALSEALVNLRDGLALATSREILSPPERDALVERARATFYPERSWARTFGDAAAIGVEPKRVDRLRGLVAEERPNAKRRDAIAALRHVAGSLDRLASPPTFDFEPTEFWHQLVSTTARAEREGDGAGDDDGIAAAAYDHARIAVDDYRALRDRALLSVLAASAAARDGIRPTPEQITAAAERFRFERGLASADKMRAWLAENRLTARDFTELCRLDVVCDELAARQGRLLRDSMTDALKRSGRFADLAAAARAHRRALADRGTPAPSLEDAGTDARGLLAWYAERFRPLHGGIEAHAKERGFADTAAFLREVVRAYAAEKADAPRPPDVGR